MTFKPAPPPWYRPAESDEDGPLSQAAILAVVLALAGWLTLPMGLPWAQLPLEAGALAIGIIARRQIGRHGLSGRGLTTLAIALSVLALVLIALAYVAPTHLEGRF